MRQLSTRLSAVLTACALLVLGLVSALAAAPDAVAARASSPWTTHHACPATHGLRATCLAGYRVLNGARPDSDHLLPGGLDAAALRSAYKLPADGGAGRTVAIVDAYNDPKAESDLAVFRAHNNLPACTTANGCFRQVNQRGKPAPLPDGDPGWGLEISLDLDAVSSVCPACHLLLVEGDDNEFDSLGAAENTAVALGAKIVTNSYGSGQEFTSMLALGRKYYTHPGVAIVASSGDEGFDTAGFPAVLPNVISVGGTVLYPAGNARGWKEHAWAGASTLCSGYVSKPSWQPGTNCPTRNVSDISADASLDSGLNTYDTFGLRKYNGFLTVGGTSLSSPLIAGMIGVAGNASALSSPRYIYEHTSSIFDVVGGSNGYCGGDYLCTAVTGYDGPTGVGTPNGTGAL